MKKIIALVIMASFLMVGTYSCKKYEEGPTISLNTKTTRLARNWKLDQVKQDGVDVTNTTEALEQYFGKDGDYIFRIDGVEYTGSWEFGSDKESILIKMNGSGDTETMKIIRLKSSELWLDESVISQTRRYYWIEKED